MLGIVVLTYNNWSDTFQCIRSIYESPPKTKYRIILVDNCSPEPYPKESGEWFTKEEVTYIRAKENRGYSAGNNLGISIALRQGCNEILIANNDIVFLDNTIDYLLNYLGSYSDTGIVGPAIYQTDGKLQPIQLGVKMGLAQKYLYVFRKTPFKRCIKKFLNDFTKEDVDRSSPFEVYMVSGCCFLMSQACIMELTPFDEHTFLYEEENILGCRLHESGLKAVYCPKSKVIHKHEQSTKSNPSFAYTCLVESEIYYCRAYLHHCSVALFPLYMIRAFKYLTLCVKYENYRKNIRNFFRSTISKLTDKEI